MEENENQVVAVSTFPETFEKHQEVELVTNVASEEQSEAPKPRLTLKKKKLLAAMGIALLLFIGSAGYICMNLHFTTIPSEDHLSVATQPSLDSTPIGVTSVSPASGTPVERTLLQNGPIRTVQSFDQFKAKRALQQPNFRPVRSLKRKLTNSLPRLATNNPFARSSLMLKKYIEQRHKNRLIFRKPAQDIRRTTQHNVIRRNLRGQIGHKLVVYSKSTTINAPNHHPRVVLRRRPGLIRRAVVLRKNPSIRRNSLVKHKVDLRQKPHVRRVLRRVPVGYKPKVRRAVVLRRRPAIGRGAQTNQKIVHRPVFVRQNGSSHFPQSSNHKNLV